MKRGFTLVEVIIAAGLAAIFGAMVVGILFNQTNFSKKEASVVSTNISVNDTTTQISNNIKQAMTVATGYPESSPIYTTGASILVLKLPAIINGGSTANSSDYAVIYPDNSKTNLLMLKIFPNLNSSRKNVTQVLTSNLSGINFVYKDRSGNAVNPTSASQVSVTLSINSKNGQVSNLRVSTFNTTLRNN